MRAPAYCGPGVLRNLDSAFKASTSSPEPGALARAYAGFLPFPVMNMMPSIPGGNGQSGIARSMTASNMNTLLLWATMALISFTGWTGYENSISLAQIKGSLVTRPELEAKLAEVKAQQASLDKDITELKLALAERGIASTPKQR